MLNQELLRETLETANLDSMTRKIAQISEGDSGT